MIRPFLLLLVSCLLAACAARQPLPNDSAVLTPGAVVETLSSTITLSLRTAEKNLAGRGVMVYRRPDQLRLILLSPFGTTVMEALVSGDQLTLAYPASGVAYQGKINELPAATGQRGFAMLRWVLASDAPAGAPHDGEMERLSSRGGIERISLQNGQVVEKNLPGGEQVRYRNHAVLAGVRLPLELLMMSAEGDRIRLTLEEPEVNIPLEDQMFTIPLQGLRLLPLSELKSP
ncbi:MAG: lipoprotein insertase outer membrane protein LolB [Trichlorobacter sp.]